MNKINPDIIVTWPRNCDYPLWRQFIRNTRTMYNEIIVVFTETNDGDDYREFVRKAMFADYVHFVDSPRALHGTDDWRNIAVNAGLLRSYNAGWLWFTEQDFIVNNVYEFREFVESKHYDDNYDVVAFGDGGRMHPCCIFMKRETLEKTSKNFGIVPDKLDHFGLIQKDIENKNIPMFLMSKNESFLHLAGLSHNMKLAREGVTITHQPKQFATYIEQSLRVSVPLNQRWVKVFENWLRSYNN